MKLFKPYNYLYYIIGVWYQFLGIGNMTYPSIAGLIATLQMLNIVVIGSLFRKYIVFNSPFYLIGAYILLVIVNFIHFGENSYYEFENKWKNEKFMWRILNSILAIGYIILSFISLFSIQIINK